MRKVRVAALLGVGAMLAVWGIPATAVAHVPAAAAIPPGVISQQVVISELTPSGLPLASQIVTRVIVNDQPYGQVSIPTATNDLHFVDRRGTPEVNGDNALVLMGGDGQSEVTLGAAFQLPLPVAMHAEYTIDGVAVPAEAVSGPGQMTLRYTVTNTVMKDVTISYTNSAGTALSQRQKVFAPFSGTFTATLPAGMSMVTTPAAVVNTNERGNTVVTWNLVLYPPLGNYQQTLSFTVASAELAVPAVAMQVAPVTDSQAPAVGFAAGLIDSSVTGNETLTSGLTELDTNATAVASGAAQLSAGLVQVASGTQTLTDTVNSQLLPGAEGVASGASQTATGSEELATGLEASATGASELASGLALLTTGLGSISDGLTTLAGPTGLPASVTASTALSAAVGQIADAVGAPTAAGDCAGDPADISTTRTLVELSNVTCAASDALQGVADDIATSLSGQVPVLVGAATDAATAAAAAGGVYQSACVDTSTLSVPQCAALLASQTSATNAKNAAASSATVVGTQAAKAAGVATGLTALTRALTSMSAGLGSVSVALRSGSATSPGVYEGLTELTAGLESAVVAVTTLATAASTAAESSAQLSTGASVLAGGLDTASTGSSQLASGSAQVATGAASVAEGTGQVASGLDQVNAGAQDAATAGEQVATGSAALESEGTATVLQSVITSSEDPAFAQAYLKAVNSMVSAAAPYAAPQGGTTRVAYVSSLTPPPNSGLNPQAQSWATLSLIGVVVLALGVLAVRRVRRVRLAEGDPTF